MQIMQNSHKSLWGILEIPTSNQVLSGIANFQGWVLTSTPQEVKIQIRIDDRLASDNVNRLPRPDVTAAVPDSASINPNPGFKGVINTGRFSNGKHTITCIAWTEHDSQMIGQLEIEINNPDELDVLKTLQTRKHPDYKQKKLPRLLTLLRCPVCLAENLVLAPDHTHLICQQCSQRYPMVDDTPIMIPGTPISPINENELEMPPSSNPYRIHILNKLEELYHTGGTALDIGSGRRQFGMDHLFQLEICVYPFTDVVSQSTLLPFRDEAFDFVFSLAVTEHVKEPWILAPEMKRITKKGGEILVDSAFLQPFHAYPDHYFNMSIFGLHELFKELEILSLDAAPHQHPYLSLRWILYRLLEGLPEEQKQKIKDMSIDQFLTEIGRYISAGSERQEALHLDEHVIQELAAGFRLHGRKPLATNKTKKTAPKKSGQVF